MEDECLEGLLEMLVNGWYAKRLGNHLGCGVATSRILV